MIPKEDWCREMGPWETPTWEELIQCKPPGWEEGVEAFKTREPCRLQVGHDGPHDWETG